MLNQLGGRTILEGFETIVDQFLERIGSDFEEIGEHFEVIFRGFWTGFESDTQQQGRSQTTNILERWELGFPKQQKVLLGVPSWPCRNKQKPGRKS